MQIIAKIINTLFCWPNENRALLTQGKTWCGTGTGKTQGCEPYVALFSCAISGQFLCPLNYFLCQEPPEICHWLPTELAGVCYFQFGDLIMPSSFLKRMAPFCGHFGVSLGTSFIPALFLK